MQVPPATGHSKTLVVPLEVVSAVGVKRCFDVAAAGPGEAAAGAAGVEVEGERGVEPGAGGDLGAVARVDGDRHVMARGGVERHVAER